MNVTSGHKPVALVIDDEVQIRRLLRITLESEGYRVLEAATGQEGINQASQYRPDIIILDIGLPDMEGGAVLKRVREWSLVPVIMLSVCNREEDKVAALEHGADDYITKPFGSGELLARLRVAQRHAAPSLGNTIFRSGKLEVDLADRVVKFKGQEVKLTPTEYAMARMFVKNVGKVLTHGQILREVWGPTYAEQTQYLRVYIAHLREKLEADPAKPSLFLTVPGVGYRLVEAGSGDK